PRRPPALPPHLGARARGGRQRRRPRLPRAALDPRAAGARREALRRRRLSPPPAVERARPPRPRRVCALRRGSGADSGGAAGIRWAATDDRSAEASATARPTHRWWWTTWRMAGRSRAGRWAPGRAG